MPYFNSRGVAMPESAPESGRVQGTSAGGETITAPPGNTSVAGEGGGDTLIGSAGDNRFWITHPKDVIIEQPGGGIDTLTAYTATRLPANVENLYVNGAFNWAVGNALGNLIVVDDETHWIYGAGGDDVLVGSATGKTTFLIRAGEGSDVIYNWNGNSQLQLLNYGFATAAQVRSAMTQQGSDVLLRLSATETLTIRDETLATIADRQFLLPLDRSLLGDFTFRDEFDTLDIFNPMTGAGKWRTDFGGNLKDQWAYTLVTNGEQQVYVQPGFYGRGEEDIGANPFSLSNGVLTITAERVPEEHAYAAWNRDFTSGMLNTLGMFKQQYGYFEIRAELPTAVGSWPAFWMIPEGNDGTREGDIMEALAATPEYHYARALGGADTIYDNTFKIDTGGFHTYGMLWTASTVTFYYDGVAMLTGKTPASWTDPMAMIVNLAVGGWGGNPDFAAFPAQLKIDYVRAYALADGSTKVVQAAAEAPIATLRTAGAAGSEASAVMVFAESGRPVSDGKIQILPSKPTAAPAGQTFVIWEDAGAVFGAPANNGILGPSTTLMAGSVSAFTGTGTWLTTGKLVFGYYKTEGAVRTAWAMVFDPAKLSFTRHELGTATGDVRFVATPGGGFVASWDAAGGVTMGRAYDEALAYGGDIPGWYGPVRQLAGDVTGVTASGKVIAGNELYSIYGASGPPPSSVGTSGPDNLTGTNGGDTLRGQDGADQLFGNDAADDLQGNRGNDTVYGGFGNDWLVGGADNDEIYGQEGLDILMGNAGNDTLDGGIQNDVVRGGKGDDLVKGDWGDDFLSGDQGTDTLYGGGGADTFHSSATSGLDYIADFNRSEGDRLNLAAGSQFSVKQVGANVVVDIVGGAQVVVQGVQLAALDPSWIYVG